MFHPINSCEGLLPDTGNWVNFLEDCEILSSNDVWTHYSSGNWHYIVHNPTNLVYDGVYGQQGLYKYEDMIADTIKTLCNMLNEGIVLAELSPQCKADVDRIDRILSIMYKTL